MNPAPLRGAFPGRRPHRAGAGPAALWTFLATFALAFALLGFPMSRPPGNEPSASSPRVPDPIVPASAALSEPSGPPSPAGGGESTLTLNPHDPADFPNTGVEANITGFVPRLLGPLTSFQIAAEESMGGYDAVFGLFQNSTFGPIGFFEVFTSSGDQTVHLAYGAPQAPQPGEGYEFRLQVSDGTRWNLSVNGAPFSSNPSDGAFDFGASSSTVAAGLGFSEVAFYQSNTSAVVPASITVTTALAVRTGSGWYLPENATTSFSGTAGGVWGIEGRDQSPSLAPGEVLSGTSVAPLPDGSPLWSGGPVAVDIGFSLSSGTTTATLPVEAHALVHDGASRPIPGVPLAISDSLGGEAPAGGNLTDATGSAELVLTTPNVSASQTDLVRISSTVLGYLGMATLPLTLIPAVEIELDATPGAPTVPVNGTVLLQFRTMIGGVVAPHTPLEFSSTLGGSVSVASGESDANGTFTLAFQAGGQPTVVFVRAAVAEPGAWGAVSVPVHVVRPPPSAWIRAEPYAAVALAALLGAIVLLTLRRRRARPVPPLTFLSGAAGRGARDPTTGRAGPISRTPPSGGSP